MSRVVETEQPAAHVARVDADVLAPLVRGGLRLLAPSAIFVFGVAAMLVVGGASEPGEMRAWVMAFAIAVPAGLWLGARQERLTVAAPESAPRALAIGIGVLGLALLVRRLGTGDRLHHAILLVAAGVALAAPWWAARRWSEPRDDNPSHRWPGIVSAVTLLGAAALFLPDGVVRARTLTAAVVATAVTLTVLRAVGTRSLPRAARYLVDVVLAIGLVGAVAFLPDLQSATYSLVHHHNFFLGPVNDVLHGRAMLNGTWSQYGVGVIDWLALVFGFVGVGYGHMFLLVVALTGLQYVCLLGTLRLAGVGQLLAAATVAVAALGNAFAIIDVYANYPNVTALRFGLPYLLILAGVLATRRPQSARALLWVQMAVVALAAVWSFESWVYTSATFALMAIVDSLAGPGATRRVLIRGAQAAGVTVASVLAFTLATRALSGGADWGPYLEYLRLYSTQGFAQLRIDFFSPGPLMGAELFLGTVALLWLARDRPQAIARPARVALAGYTGFAVAAFTYYIGRSHANNLWVLLVPAVAIGGLWVHVLLSAPAQTWRTVAAAMLLLVGGMIAADAFPSLRGRWQQTAIGKILPLAGGDSIGQALTRIWHEPVLDPRALGGETLLRRHAPGQGRALVLTEPDLTVEILLRSDRANLLPMSHPTEDDLLMSNHERVRAAAERIPAGTLMLTSPPPTSGRTPVGGPRTFTLLQRHALEILHRRFDWETIDRAPSGLMMVRLRPRR